jgi:hypothetical protein
LKLSTNTPLCFPDLHQTLKIGTGFQNRTEIF